MERKNVTLVYEDTLCLALSAIVSDGLKKWANGPGTQSE